MSFAKAVNLGLMVAISAAGCNPNAFDTALDKAPVVSFDIDSSSGALFVLPLSSPTPSGTVAARMLVSRKDNPRLAVAEYDKNGKVTVHQVSDTDLANLGNAPVNSAATLGADSPIILGTPKAGAVGSQSAPGRVSLLTLTTLSTGSASLSVQGGPQGSDHFGISVAAGRVTDLAGPGEFVAVSDYAVDLLSTDVKSVVAHTSCQAVDLSDATAGTYANRPVVVADLVAGGGEEIVLSGLGRVVFLQYNRTTTSLDCLSLVLTQGAQASFGTSLAVADFDGDGNMDLAVGAPPDRVYVYFGPIPLDATAAEFVTIVGSAGSSAFGKRLSSYPMPAPSGARLMVDDPSAAVGGRSGAGKVTLLSVPRSVGIIDAAALPSSILFDSADDSPTGVFGDNLGSLQFDTRVCNPAGGGVVSMPWATSGTSVLTYFNYPGNLADPRCSQ
jgi:hypothetical protein